jgi:glutathionylspermidine amidase/synthetase
VFSIFFVIFTGMTWQCVEYARRWLFIRKGCVFDTVVGAADMWTQLNNVQRVVDRKCFNLKKYPNGSPSPPIKSIFIDLKSFRS